MHRGVKAGGVTGFNFDLPEKTGLVETTVRLDSGRILFGGIQNLAIRRYTHDTPIRIRYIEYVRPYLVLQKIQTHNQDSESPVASKGYVHLPSACQYAPRR